MSESKSDFVASELGLPLSVAQPALMVYRSVGIGTYGVVMRTLCMPLEKIALYLNSSQVSGKNQFQQAWRLTFQEGWYAPYRVVGAASIISWFAAYAVMGTAFQFMDRSISKMLGVAPVCYGEQLMVPTSREEQEKRRHLSYEVREVLARVLSPLSAAILETVVSNRAEVERFYGVKKFNAIELKMPYSPLRNLLGPAFMPGAMRNIIMMQTNFILTPILYKEYFPQEHKSTESLFLFCLGTNVFLGNAIGITQQALWGRSLDYLEQHGRIRYSEIIKDGLKKEGMSAFFTPTKWASRTLMNTPPEGALPYFYNEILPLGEEGFLVAVKKYLYDPYLKEKPSFKEKPENAKMAKMVRRASVRDMPELQDYHNPSHPDSIHSQHLWRSGPLFMAMSSSKVVSDEEFAEEFFEQAAI